MKDMFKEMAAKKLASSIAGKFSAKASESDKNRNEYDIEKSVKLNSEVSENVDVERLIMLLAENIDDWNESKDYLKIYNDVFQITYKELLEGNGWFNF